MMRGNGIHSAHTGCPVKDPPAELQDGEGTAASVKKARRSSGGGIKSAPRETARRQSTGVGWEVPRETPPPREGKRPGDVHVNTGPLRRVTHHGRSTKHRAGARTRRGSPRRDRATRRGGAGPAARGGTRPGTLPERQHLEPGGPSRGGSAPGPVAPTATRPPAGLSPWGLATTRMPPPGPAAAHLPPSPVGPEGSGRDERTAPALGVAAHVLRPTVQHPTRSGSPIDANGLTRAAARLRLDQPPSALGQRLHQDQAGTPPPLPRSDGLPGVPVTVTASVRMTDGVDRARAQELSRGPFQDVPEGRSPVAPCSVGGDDDQWAAARLARPDVVAMPSISFTVSCQSQVGGAPSARVSGPRRLLHLGGELAGEAHQASLRRWR